MLGSLVVQRDLCMKVPEPHPGTGVEGPSGGGDSVSVPGGACPLCPRGLEDLGGVMPPAWMGPLQQPSGTQSLTSVTGLSLSPKKQIMQN